MRSRSLHPAVASCCWLATAPDCRNIQVHAACCGKNKVCYPVVIDKEKPSFSSIWRSALSLKKWLSADKRWKNKACSVLQEQELLSIKILKETINALQMDSHLLMSPMVHLLLTQPGVPRGRSWRHPSWPVNVPTAEAAMICISISQHLSFITIPAISKHYVTVT